MTKAIAAVLIAIVSVAVVDMATAPEPQGQPPSGWIVIAYDRTGAVMRAYHRIVLAEARADSVAAAQSHRRCP